MPEQIIDILPVDEDWPDYESKLKREISMRRRKRAAWEETEGVRDDGKYTGSDQPAGGKITCNFEQVEAALNERMHEFDGAVFTEESKALAKKIVAGLRSEQKKFAENLKEEKKKYMAPWDSFEARAKVLIAKYDEPVNSINGQVKEMEEKRINEKRKQISQIYLEVTGGTDVDNYISFERIYNPKWENATYKERDIRKDIVSAAAAVNQAVTTIRMMNSESEDKAIEVYKNNLDLAEAITYINQFEQQKRDIIAREEEMHRKEEEARVRREEREKLEAEQKARAAGQRKNALLPWSRRKQ